MESTKNSLAMQELYSPVNSYQSIFKQVHSDNVSNLFKELVEISKIDIEANRNKNKEIAKNNGKTADNNRLIKKQKNLKDCSILLIIISALAIIISALKMSSSSSIGINISVIVLAIFFIVLSIFLIRKAKDELSELHNIEDKLLEISKKLHSEAEEQIRPLNQLLLKNYNTELFTKTIPLVEFDKAFDSKRLDYMTGKFGFNASAHEKNLEQSTLFVQSGEIKGNPFFIRENLQHKMGTKRYEGSLRIRWTTTKKDSDGNPKTVHHSETLYADVVKPCPSYSISSHLVYGNEVGDRLSFSRKPSYIHELKERKVDREIKKRSRELQKLAEKSTKKGGTFTALANNEFDSLFYAKDRDDESQFRLLFTPLAQQELIKLIKDKEVGFGDDFSFYKKKMINYIYPDHLKDSKLNVPIDYFTGFDYDKVENNFKDFHRNYFKHMFFTFAPLFTIPLYTQYQTQEYLYKELYDSVVSFYQHEMVANNLDLNKISPSNSVTNNIIKTTLVGSHDNVDRLNIRVWGYKTIEREDYISKYGGDGNWHAVPVNWTEYIRVIKNSTIEVKVANGESFEKQADEKWLPVGNILARIVN